MKSLVKICSIFYFVSITSLVLSQNDSLYREQLYPDWINTSYNEAIVNLRNTSPTYSGGYSISISLNSGWGGFVLSHMDNKQEPIYLYPNQYKYINFRIRADLTLDLLVGISFENRKLVPYSAGVWTNIRIPISELNPENKPFNIFGLFNQADVLPVFYVDDIYFEYIDDSEKPVISDVTITNIQTDSVKITWKTNEYVSYTLQYKILGSADNYTIIEHDDYTIAGNDTLTGLLPSTNYEFIIKCSDHQRDTLTPPNLSEYSGSFVTASPQTIWSLNNTKPQILIFPNPVKQTLHIDNVSTSEPIFLKIIDNIGRNLLNEQLLSKYNEIQMPENSNIFFIQLLDNSGKIINVSKILKQ